jgi:nucleotide-binding universal stress UspA family protein
MFRQVLVPVSFSACDRQLARYACTVTRAIGGAVTLLHVLELSVPGGVSVTAQKAAAQELLAQLSLLARRPPTCLIVPTSGEGVAEVILSVAGQTGADLIMLGLQEQTPIHGRVRNNFPQRSQGHVLWPVLLGARVPVQVVPCLQHELPAHDWRSTLAGSTRTVAGS